MLNILLPRHVVMRALPLRIKVALPLPEMRNAREGVDSNEFTDDLHGHLVDLELGFHALARLQLAQHRDAKVLRELVHSFGADAVADVYGTRYHHM